jgi:hypothetical protein
MRYVNCAAVQAGTGTFRGGQAAAGSRSEFSWTQHQDIGNEDHHAVALVVARLQVLGNGAGQVVVAQHLDADIRRRRPIVLKNSQM